MDWNRKRSELRAATIAAVDALLATLKGEQLYAICLQTDDGVMSVGPCANSEQGYAAANDGEVSPADRFYYRWTTAEWQYEMFGDAQFHAVNRDFIAAGTSDTSPEAFDQYHAQFLAAMIDALAHLRAERAAALRDVTLFATITDSDDAQALEDRSAALLNPPHLAAAFARRYPPTA